MQKDKIIAQLVEALEEAKDHLEYCNYGDSWERECAICSRLAFRIDEALKAANGGKKDDN